MIRLLFALSVLATALGPRSLSAATAVCFGKIDRTSLYFEASGSLQRKNDGLGFVKMNNRIVAEFDGDTARINYLTRSFSIRNDRGDLIQGKLRSLSTGASTLTQMILPGEGVRLFNVPVKCSIR